MTVKGVTSAQLDHLRQMANLKGVDCEFFQRGLDEGTFGTALDAVRLGKRIEFAREPVPPDKGRIYELHLPVALEREWQEAVDAAGPNTPASYNVRKIGDLYAPTGAGIAWQSFVFLNFGSRGGSFDRAVAWADQYCLKRTPPRSVFAVGGFKPNLHRELCMDLMYVVATEECSFAGVRQACSVWWAESEREARLAGVGYYDDAYGWFAFLR